MNNLAYCNIHALIEKENCRYTRQISLIASENHTPADMREILSSSLMNKYAEGYPGTRYYGGCAVVDEIEQCAIDACKKLFDPHDRMHVNVQPHSGSDANAAIYMAFANHGDGILGMDLCSGGHLSHGNKANFSSACYQAVTYQVDPTTGLISYADVERLAQTFRPKILIAGASAYSRIIDFERFAGIAQRVGAFFVADIAHIAGLIAAGLHPSPVAYADGITGTTHKTLQGPRGGFILCKKEFARAVDRAVMPGIQGGPAMNVIAAKALCFQRAATPIFINYQKQVLSNAAAMAEAFTRVGYSIVSGGTDTHLFVVDLRSVHILGKTAEQQLDAIGINTSRSTVPRDCEKPLIGSGIRIGTAAMTARGMREAQAHMLVDYIDTCLRNGPSEQLAQRVADIAQQFPIP